MMFLSREERTVRLGPHQRAVYDLDGRWEIVDTAGGAARVAGTLLTEQVLEKLSGDAFERERASGIVAYFGDAVALR